jgi:hypothetical protein
MTAKTLSALAFAVLFAAAPAMAQSGWSQYRMGDHTYYNGTGDNNGWNGSSYRMGDHTYSNFQGPNGQTRNCSSYQMGDHVYTNCN